jgi:hypothetical protein
MSGIALLAAGLAGVALGARLGTRLTHLTDPLDRLIAAMLLVCAQIVVVSLVTGAIFDHFEPRYLLLATGVWDAVLVIAVTRVRPRAVRPGLIATAGAAMRQLALWQRLVVCAAGLAIAWRLVLAAVLPPFAYDALAYHLTAVASWVQSGRIAPNPYALCCGRYPSNAEVLFAWPTVFLGRDTLTDAVQIFAALLGALAVTGLARAAGTSPAGSITAAALFLLTPIVLTQANTDYNDVTVAAMFLVAIYFGVRLLASTGFAFAAGGESPRLAYAVLAGAASGFAAGTKTNGVVFAAAVAAPLFAQLALAGWRRRLPRAWCAAAAIVFAGAVLIVGGWWYGRNWAETGNPVSPFRVSIAGAQIFPGTARLHDYLTTPPWGSRNVVDEVARSWYYDLTFWTRSDYSYEERSGGLGPLWSWLGWPLVTLVALAALRRRHDLVVSIVIPVVLAFGLLPYRWWSRFTIYLAALGAVAVVIVIERLSPGRSRAILCAAAVVLALAGGVLATWRVDPAGFGRKLLARDVISLAAHPKRPRTVGSLFFREFAWLDRVPPDARIAVEWDAPSIRFLYPLFGSRLDRRVDLLFRGDENRLDTLLAARRDGYFFVEEHGRFAHWARAHPARFHPIFTDRGTEVFRLGT